ncbi:hypothetical protein TNCT_99931 [Trichonephila clavata]|uniref:Uncharacterized protein n=1 Tax=Trichonephila clavata TaxID=2740835 RepID=A0A8X6HSI7_TRICU|nr:hypothetical protein TNCT_99931 [Trichonephila clavata]
MDRAAVGFRSILRITAAHCVCCYCIVARIATFPTPPPFLLLSEERGPTDELIVGIAGRYSLILWSVVPFPTPLSLGADSFLGAWED